MEIALTILAILLVVFVVVKVAKLAIKIVIIALVVAAIATSLGFNFFTQQDNNENQGNFISTLFNFNDKQAQNTQK